MKRVALVGFFISSWTGLGMAQAGSHAEMEALPPRTPATAASLYRLTFEFDEGVSYREFIRTVPNAFTVKEPRDLVEVCHRLGVEAKHRKANWSEVLQLKEPFLARNQREEWFLYQVQDESLLRLEAGKKDPTPVPETEFLQSWSHDLITLAKAAPVPLTEDGPRIQFQETDHDFGEVWQGERVEHAFVFENVGSSTLEIINVRASCGCTAALVGRAVGSATRGVMRSAQNDKQFAPGESGHIKVSLSTKGKRNRTGSTVTVSTNDPTKATVQLRVNATVKVAVEISPMTAYFGRITKNSNLTKEIRIRAPSDANFEILGATCSNPRVRLELEPVDKASGNGEPVYILKVSLDIDGLTYGDGIHGTIQVRTSSKHSPEFQIPLNAQLTGEVVVNTPTLSFGYLAPNNQIPRFVMVTNTGSLDIEILEVRNSIPNLSLETKTLTDGKRFRIDAVLKTGENPQPLAGEIIIVTTHPEQPEIRVPVSAYVRKGS
jgi:hypothetical protein